MRVRRPSCAKCAAAIAPSAVGMRWAIRLDGRFVARFTYPPESTDAAERKRARKAWEASGGVRVAEDVKAVLGDVPFLWPNADSAGAVASWIRAELARVCGACASEIAKRVS